MMKKLNPQNKFKLKNKLKLKKNKSLNQKSHSLKSKRNYKNLNNPICKTVLYSW